MDFVNEIILHNILLWSGATFCDSCFCSM